MDAVDVEESPANHRLLVPCHRERKRSRRTIQAINRNKPFASTFLWSLLHPLVDDVGWVHFIWICVWNLVCILLTILLWWSDEGCKKILFFSSHSYHSVWQFNRHGLCDLTPLQIITIADTEIQVFYALHNLKGVPNPIRIWLYFCIAHTRFRFLFCCNHYTYIQLPRNGRAFYLLGKIVFLSTYFSFCTKWKHKIWAPNQMFM